MSVSRVSAAESRALSRLARLHPKDYKRLEEETLAFRHIRSVNAKTAKLERVRGDLHQWNMTHGRQHREATS